MITVLYVDDEETLLEIGKTYLEMSGGISVDTALSADEGLQKIRINAYDAIVSDYQMPGMDGIRFLTVIRKEYPHLPFIIFTGRGREEIVIEAYEKGVDFYLQKGGAPKPLFTELSHKIRAVVDHRRDEARVKTFNRLYSVLSATNKAIVHVRDKKELLSEICRIAVEIGGFALIWAGIANPQTRTIEPVTSFGDDDGYLHDVYISMDEGPRGSGPSSVAFRTKKYMICNDIATDPWMDTVKQAALQRGYRALAAFPFALDTTDAGVITFYAPVPGFFDDHIVSLLEEMAHDITFAFGTINDELRRKEAEASLKKRNQVYQTLTMNIPGIVYRVFLREHGRMEFYNDELPVLTGYTCEELTAGKICSIELHILDDDRQVVISTVEKAISTHSPFRVEYRFRAKNGEIRTFHERGRPVYDPEGVPEFIDGVIFDATEQKRMESALQESEQRLINLVANLPGMAYRCRGDRNGIMDYVSEGSLPLTGYEPAALVNNTKIAYSDLIHPEDRTIVRNQILDAIAQKRRFALVYRILTADREQKWVWEQGSCMEGRAGEPAVLEGFVTDITERVNSERALEESENRYHTLFETAAEGIIVVDSGTREFLHANPAICAMLGYSEDEFVGMHVNDIHPAEDLAFVLREFEALSQGERQRATDIPCLRKDKEVIYADIATSQVTIDGRLCIVGFFSDVTERKLRLLQMQAEHEFSIALINKRTLPELLSFGVNSAIGISRMDCGGIYLVDPKTRSMDLVYSAGLSDEFVKIIAYLAADSPQARLVYRKKPVYSQHSSLIDPDNLGRKEGIRAIAVIPVLHNDEVIACFNIASRTRDTVPEQDRALLETVTSQMGNVIARVQAEEAYHESEKRYRRLVEAVTDYIYTVHIEGGRVTDTTHGPGCEAITGYRSDEFATDPYLWFRMVVEEDRPAIVRQAEEVLAGKDRTPLEHRIIRKDGSIRWVKNTPVSRHNQKGELVAYDGLIEDITDRKQVGEALKLTNKKLNLLSSITRHDILNQMVALLNVLDMIKEQEPDESLKNLLVLGERAAENIHRQIRFTEEYQDLGITTPQWQNVRNTFLHAAGLLQTGNVRVTADTGSVEVYADPLFEKVFYNLIDNALTHAGKISRISLQYHATNNGLVMTVEDDGIGVPAEEKSLIFDRGFGKHTGLGLFLSKEILSITGMAITETGTPGKGARFEIHVPKSAFRIA
ncbi:MAG: PAS domain S-box protein [Methanoregula sp.]